MKNLSKEFRRALYSNERDYVCTAEVTLANGTELTFNNTNIWSGGFEYEEAVSQDDVFSALGSVIIGSAKLTINNIDESYSQYDFTNAEVVLYIGMQFTNLENLKVGVYTVDSATYNGGTIQLSLLDNICQLDRPYKLSNLDYPATLGDIVRDICSTCGITLATSSATFPHDDVSIAVRPEDESITFREVLSWVCIISGTFAKCTVNGELNLQWFNTTALENFTTELDGGTFNPWSGGTTYDGGTFNPWSTGTEYDGGTIGDEPPVHIITGLFSQNIAMDDTVITGVSVTVKDEDEESETNIITYSVGTSGYVIQIDANPFIDKTNAQTILAWLGTQLIGLRFRKVNITCTTDPAIEAGDVGVVIDRKENVYWVLITRTTFSVSGNQTIVSGSSTPSRNSATKFSVSTKSFVEARKLLKQQKTSYDLALENLSTALAAKSGLYSTIEQAQSGNIYYLHDKELLSNSKVVWKMNAEAVGVTTNYNGTNPSATVWNFGVQVNGTVIAAILTAIGVNADWINTGALVVKNDQNVEIFKADVSNKTIAIKGEYITLGNVSLSNAISNSITTFGNSLTQQDIFNRLTNNGAAQGLALVNGQLYISFSYAQGGTLTLGGSNNANGLMVIKNASNTEIGRWSNAGIEVKKGSIKLGANGNSWYTQIDDNGRIDTAKLYATYGALGDMVLEDSALKYSSPYVPTTSSTNNVYFGKYGLCISGRYNNCRMRTIIQEGKISCWQELTLNGVINEVFRVQTGSGRYEDGEAEIWLAGSSAALSSVNPKVVFRGNYEYAYSYFRFLTINTEDRLTLTSGSLSIRLDNGIHPDIEMNGKVSVSGDLSVTGTKSRLVDTDDYAERLLYAYEMPSPMFGDIGEGVISDDGLCYVQIDPIFSETINTSQYQVFLQKYGTGDCFVSERHPTYFIVEGTSGLAFGWEMKAKQADFDQMRLDKVDIGVNTRNAINYIEDASEHINNIYHERGLVHD